MRKILSAAALMALLSGCSLLDPTAPTAEIGECFDVQGSGAQVDSINGFDCAQEHDAEVYFKANLTLEGDYDDVAIDAAAQEMCLDQYTDYVGVDYYNSTLDIYYLFPIQDGWDSGDREVICAVYTPDYEGVTDEGYLRTSGSVKGSNQ